MCGDGGGRGHDCSTRSEPRQIELNRTQITDDGCAHLASRLRSGALPALEDPYLEDITVSYAAKAAVQEARLVPRPVCVGMPWGIWHTSLYVWGT